MTGPNSPAIGPLVPDQAAALRALAELAEGLVERARRLIADGVAPLEAVDRVAREADPKALVALAYIALIAGLTDESKPPPSERPN